MSLFLPPLLKVRFNQFGPPLSPQSLAQWLGRGSDGATTLAIPRSWPIASQLLRSRLKRLFAGALVLSHCSVHLKSIHQPTGHSCGVGGSFSDEFRIACCVDFSVVGKEISGRVGSCLLAGCYLQVLRSGKFFCGRIGVSVARGLLLKDGPAPSWTPSLTRDSQSHTRPYLRA